MADLSAPDSACSNDLLTILAEVVDPHLERTRFPFRWVISTRPSELP